LYAQHALNLFDIFYHFLMTCAVASEAYDVMKLIRNAGFVFYCMLFLTAAIQLNY